MRLLATSLATTGATLTIVASLLGALYPSTAPGVGPGGYAFDLSDLTEEKLNWRRNLFSETEFRNGIADLQLKSGVTASNLAGYDGALVVAPGGYAYKTLSHVAGQAYNFSVIGRMDDGLPPVFTGGDSSGAGTDFAIITQGNALAPLTYVVNDLGGGFFRASVSYVAFSGGVNTGVVKYPANSSRTFKVTGYQLSKGADLKSYQRLTDAYTEFLAAFPYHSNFRENTFATPTMSLEDPVGGVIDLRFGGLRGPELWASPVLDSGWVLNGDGSYTKPVGVNSNLRVPGKAVAGLYYEFKYTVIEQSGSVGIRPLAGSGTLGSAGIVGKNRCILRASTNDVLYINSGTNSGGTVRDISVCEVYGYHATQVTPGDRPSASAKYNLHLDSVNCPSGSDGTSTAVVTSIIAPSGHFATRVTAAATYGTTYYRYSIGASSIVGVTETRFAFVKPEAGVTTLGFETSGGSAFYMRYNVATGVAVKGSFATAAGVEVLADGWLKMWVVGTPTSANITTVTTALIAAGPDANTLTSVLWGGWHRELTSLGALTKYQRVNSATDYDYVGFPMGARFNGINQWLLVLGVQMGGADKLRMGMTYKKEANPSSGDGILIEMGTAYTSPGRAVLAGAVSAGNSSGIYTRGSSSTNGNTTLTTPGESSILVGVVDWDASSSLLSVRKNGVLANATVAVGGTGAIADNVDHYLMRRGGAGAGIPALVSRITCRGGEFRDDMTLNDQWLNERWKLPITA